MQVPRSPRELVMTSKRVVVREVRGRGPRRRLRLRRRLKLSLIAPK